MPYTTPSSRMTGDLITAAIWNADIVDNLEETAPAKVEAAYDWLTGGSAAGMVKRTEKATDASVVYQGATGPAFLAPEPGKYVRFNAAGDGLEAADPTGATTTVDSVDAVPNNGNTWTATGLEIALSEIPSNVDVLLKVTIPERDPEQNPTIQYIIRIRKNSVVFWTFRGYRFDVARSQYYLDEDPGTDPEYDVQIQTNAGPNLAVGEASFEAIEIIR